MKVNQKEQLKKKDLAGLELKLSDKVRQLMEARVKLGQGKLKNTALIRELKRDVSIIKTYIGEIKLKTLTKRRGE